MRVKKFVIGPGVYWYADEVTGQPRSLKVTPELVEHWHQSGKDMLAAGLSIPIPLEHQKEATPLTAPERAAQRLKNNAGWVAGYELDADKQLWSLCDIEDEDIARKLPKTIRWTSPYISSFTDGQGKRWDGVISHLALTTRPRIVKQQPFPTVAAAMSFAAAQPPVSWSPSLVPPNAGLMLSRAGKLLLEDGKPPRPAYPIAFSLFAGGMAFADMPPTEKKTEPPKGDPAKKEGEIPPKKEGESSSTPPDGLDKVEKALVDGDGDIKVTDVLCDLLSMMGIELQEGSPENFLDRLYTAMVEYHKAHQKNGDDMGNDTTTTTPPPPPAKPGTAPAAPVRQEQPPLYMGLSLEQAKAEADKVTDPAQKALLQAAFSMLEANNKTLDGLKAQALARGQALRDERIARLSRNLPPAARDKLIAMAQGVKLSVGDDVTVTDPMTSMLEVLEASARELPALMTTPASQLSGLRVMDHPQEYSGEIITNEQAEAAADKLAQGIPDLAPKKAS